MKNNSNSHNKYQSYIETRDLVEYMKSFENSIQKTTVEANKLMEVFKYTEEYVRGAYRSKYTPSSFKYRRNDHITVRLPVCRPSGARCDVFYKGIVSGVDYYTGHYCVEVRYPKRFRGVSILVKPDRIIGRWKKSIAFFPDPGYHFS